MKAQVYAAMPEEAVLTQLSVQQAQGLDDKEVVARRVLYGKNSLEQGVVTWFAILFRQLQSPFFYLLSVAAMLSLYLGETSNALLIAVFIGINTFFGFYQEYHAERTVIDLRKIIASKTTVRRAGVVLEVFMADLVPGDIVLLEPGDIVPADMRFLEVQNCAIDESVLTGESMPRKKTAHAQPRGNAQTYDSMAYAGTTVMTGTAVGVVVAIGKACSFGALAEQAGSIKRESLFARNIRTFTLLMMLLIAITLSAVILLHMTIHPGVMSFNSLVLFAIALAVSILPEGLPVVMTFCLAQGAARLAKQRVVVKRLSAIEDLGSINVLCTDKTGTLTENSLTVVDVYGDRLAVLAAAINVNQHLLLERKDAARSFDEALIKVWDGALPVDDRLIYLPFDHQHYCAYALYPALAYIRGVPEKIVSRCVRFDTAAALAWLHEQGEQGRRVIAVAAKVVPSDLTAEQLIALEQYQFVGMVAFEDPVKASVPEAIKKAQALGLSIKIISGDTPEVAGAVAKQIGLIDDPMDVVTEAMLLGVSDDKKMQLYQQGAVFAGMSPHEKYNLVQALETQEQIGFLGEGINDAPALKMAHVALVVDNGTDIAKDAADLILLDRSLGVIVDGIAEGRRVVANTIKYIQLMLICNTSNFYSIAVASLVIDFLPMTPLQILLVNVLSDFPLIAIATDHVVLDDIAKPLQYHFPRIILTALVFGIIGSSFDFVVFRVFYTQPKMLQTVWFMFSICSELIMFYVMRTKRFFLFGHRPPRILLFFSLLSAVITVTLPLTAFGQHLFGFVVPSFREYLFFAGLLVLWPLVMEFVKVCYQAIRSRFSARQG